MSKASDKKSFFFPNIQLFFCYYFFMFFFSHLTVSKMDHSSKQHQQAAVKTCQYQWIFFEHQTVAV